MGVKEDNRIEFLSELTNTALETVSRWVNGEALPPSSHIKKLAREFLISPQWLIAGKQ